tara:strand:+ start:1978 stop:2208 length:231 start_codon:yes stop_codon:yes gene_type:complete
MKDLNYYKKNCEENYITTPISVLRYITELEKDNEAKQLILSGVGNPLKCDFCGADEIYPNLDIRLYQCKCGATKSF